MVLMMRYATPESAKSFGEWVAAMRGRATGTECARRARLSADDKPMHVQAWSRIENETTRSETGRAAELESKTLRKIAAGLEIPAETVFQAYARFSGATLIDRAIEHAGFSDNQADLTPEQQQIVDSLIEEFRKSNQGN